MTVKLTERVTEQGVEYKHMAGELRVDDVTTAQLEAFLFEKNTCVFIRFVDSLLPKTYPWQEYHLPSDAFSANPTSHIEWFLHLYDHEKERMA